MWLQPLTWLYITTSKTNTRCREFTIPISRTLLRKAVFTDTQASPERSIELPLHMPQDRPRMPATACKPEIFAVLLVITPAIDNCH
jgi:hypothetical protein